MFQRLYNKEKGGKGMKYRGWKVNRKRYDSGFVNVGRVNLHVREPVSVENQGYIGWFKKNVLSWKEMADTEH